MQVMDTSITKRVNPYQMQILYRMPAGNCQLLPSHLAKFGHRSSRYPQIKKHYPCTEYVKFVSKLLQSQDKAALNLLCVIRKYARMLQ